MEQLGAPQEENKPVQAPAAAAAARESRETEYASQFCPRCSTRLGARSCKLICPTCGYYMSCSDFY